MQTIADAELFFELNDTTFAVSGPEQIDDGLFQAEDLSEGRLVLSKDGGPRPLWHRMFGAKRWVEFLCAVEWSDAYASLIFFDENGSEYRVVDLGYRLPALEATRLKISHGELQPCAVDECISKQRAFAAIKEALVAGERPAWLTYRYVR